MEFRYHNARLRDSMDEMFKRLRDACEGKDISISSLIKDKTGNYDGDKLKALLSEIATADIPEYEYAGMTKEAEEALGKETEYLTALLYVVIRASQARLGRVVVRGGQWDDSLPVKEDTFASVISHASDEKCIRFYGSRVLSAGTRDRMFSASLEATAETVYMMITGEYRPFPDAYRPDTYGERAQVCEEPVDEAPVMIRDYDDPEDLADVCDDPEDLYDRPELSPEEEEEVNRYGMYMSYYYDHMEDYYHGDDQSDRDWKKYIGDDDDDADSYFEERQYGNLGSEKDREVFDRDARRLRLTFADQEEYVKMYEHLSSITTEERKGCESRIGNKIDEWLKENGKMIYSDEDGFMSVFELVYSAAETARKRRSARRADV